MQYWCDDSYNTHYRTYTVTTSEPSTGDLEYWDVKVDCNHRVVYHSRQTEDHLEASSADLEAMREQLWIALEELPAKKYREPQDHPFCSPKAYVIPLKQSAILSFRRLPINRNKSQYDRRLRAKGRT